MKGKITSIFLSLILCCALFVKGQGLTVSGKITDEGGTTLPGVSIKVKGTTVGTQSNASGAYSLNVSSPQVMVLKK